LQTPWHVAHRSSCSAVFFDGVFHVRSQSNDRDGRAARRQFEEPQISLEARAERVLAEYLRHWGLRDPTTIATHCRRWVREAVEHAGSEARAQPAAVYRAAVEAAMDEIDGWLDQLASLASANHEEAAARRGMLAIEVQTLIDKYPETLLKNDALPAPLVQHFRRASHPAVPSAHYTPMRAQPLGQLASPLTWQWWKQGTSRMLASAALRLHLIWPERGQA
jgi:hypothetical protein